MSSRVVQAGYDRLAPGFGEWMRRVEGDPWERFADELAERLPDGARVLDLGCGGGQKTKSLVERFDVTGVDFSEEQLRLARRSVPRATFIEGDFSELEFEEASFDAVTAFYSIAHLPREHHRRLFETIACRLRPGGFFLSTLGTNDNEGWTGDWLGVEMFFSSFDAETNRRLLREAGFELVLDEVVTMREPEGEATFLWVLARKR